MYDIEQFTEPLMDSGLFSSFGKDSLGQVYWLNLIGSPYDLRITTEVVYTKKLPGHHFGDIIFHCQWYHSQNYELRPKSFQEVFDRVSEEVKKKLVYHLDLFL